MENQRNGLVQKIRFDAEDFLPPEYWDRVRQAPRRESSDMTGIVTPMTLSMAASTIEGFDELPASVTRRLNPDEWVKAPEFIPRSAKEMLHHSFGDEVDRTSLNNFEQTSEQLPSYGANDFCAFPSATPLRNGHPSETITGGFPAQYGNGYATFGDNTAFPAVTPPPNMLSSAALFTARPPTTSSVPLSNTALPFVPPGYSVNFTSINSPNGTPIAAIVLKKKRKRRQRKTRPLVQPTSPTNSSLSGHPADPSAYFDLHKSDTFSSISTRGSSIPMKLQNATSEPELINTNEEDVNANDSGNKLDGAAFSGSCPDLSDNQLKMWDDILFNAVAAEREKNEKSQKDIANNNVGAIDSAIQRRESLPVTTTKAIFPQSEMGRTSDNTTQPVPQHEEEDADKTMRTSIYELCPPAVFDALDEAVHADGISSREVRLLEKKLNGCSLEESFTEATMVDRIRQVNAKGPVDNNPAQINKSLKEEFEDLEFKPDISEPQSFPAASGRNCQFHLATYNPKKSTVHNEIYSTIRKEDLPHLDEEYFDGMHIRVNAFEEVDDLALSDSDCPQPSRFQQMQWAIQRQKDKYVQLEAPQRVCCRLM